MLPSVDLSLELVLRVVVQLELLQVNTPRVRDLGNLLLFSARQIHLPTRLVQAVEYVNVVFTEAIVVEGIYVFEVVSLAQVNLPRVLFWLEMGIVNDQLFVLFDGLSDG